MATRIYLRELSQSDRPHTDIQVADVRQTERRQTANKKIRIRKHFRTMLESVKKLVKK